MSIKEMKRLHHLSQPGLTCCWLLLSCPLFAATDQEKIATVTEQEAVIAIEDHILQMRKFEEETINGIFIKAEEIKKIFQGVNQSEEDLGGLNGLGNVEQLRIKAERYGLELQTRRQLQQKFAEIDNLLVKWKEIMKQVKMDTEILNLKKELLKLGTTVAAESPLTQLNQKDFEYYTVKKAATLQQISALPDVYGNAELWKYLYEANKDRVKDANQTVPPGTLLVVPIIKQEYKIEED